MELGAEGQVVAGRRWHVRMVQFSRVKTDQKVREVGAQINPGGEGGRVANSTWSTLWVPGASHNGLGPIALWLFSPASGPGMLDC